MSTPKSSKPNSSKPKPKPAGASAPKAGAPVAAVAAPAPAPSGFMGRMLDGIERLGNKVPHAVLLFVYLIVGVIVLSAILAFFNVSVTQEIAVPVAQEVAPYYTEAGLPAYELESGDLPHEFEIEEQTIAIRSLLTVEGIRFIFTSFVPNFAGFTVVAVVIIAMLGVGVAEEAGMMGALIRKLVQVAPRRLLTFIIVLVGILSSIATDAGYLILVPLAGAAFLQVKRNPIAGIAAGFAAVGGVFAVNMLITPLDGMLTEVTNEAIGLITNNPPAALSVTANLFFNIGFTLIMAVVVTFVTERMIEPRLGAYDPKGAGEQKQEAATLSANAESRGLSYALYFFLAGAAVVALLALIPGAPLNGRDGGSPFLDSIIFIISLLFLLAGIGFGRGAGTLTTANQVIGAAGKTIASLGGLLLLFLVISQFIAHFNYTHMPQLLAGWLADVLGRANIGAVPLLIGFIVVILLLDIIIPNAIPKWAIFAPIFVPLFVNLGVEPQTVLAAYRIGDSPLNVVTPLMAYLPFTLIVIQRYQKNAGLGSLISLMLPYVAVVTVVWIVLFVLWYVLNIPLGPGYLPQL